jgi:PAS domain S-box-containing protein
MFFILIWYNTVLLNRRDILKSITSQELQKSIEQNAYLASLLNNTSDAVFSTDQSFIIKSWNRAAEEIYGIRAEEAIGKTTMEVITTKISEEERFTMRDNLVRKGYFISDVIHYAKDGKALEMLTSTTATKNAAGDTIGYISICHDISERKTLETQLQKTNAELEAFTYSVSHDLRAPLRGIIGFTAILEEEYANKLDDEARRLTGVIKNNAMRMGNLIDDLLNFSRLGKHSINKINIDTMQMVKQVMAEVNTNKANTLVEWILHPLPDIEADINTVRQVWINLLSNAVKYSGKNEHPVIEIGTIEKDEQQVFFVKDNGVGFDQKYSDKLFKVFQRLHSVAEFEGTGVGLALVEKIISRHDGMIWAEAEVNKGATFYFTFTNKLNSNK